MQMYAFYLEKRVHLYKYFAEKDNPAEKIKTNEIE